MVKYKAEEFNLSEKQTDGVIGNQGRCNVYQEEDVKEFIKRLKEEIVHHTFEDDEQPRSEVCGIIDKLAGKSLI